MKILVLYHLDRLNERKTIDEHLYSFERYGNANCIYVNVYYPLPAGLHHVDFDLIIFHYTFLSLRWPGPKPLQKAMRRCHKLINHKAYKIALPQDEYVYSEVMCEFLKEMRIDKLYTCFYAQDWERVYPKDKTGPVKIETTLTGFVDPDTLRRFTSLRPHRERKYDIGYRARKFPYWLGEHGTLKWRITEVFEAAQKSHPSIRMNLSNKDSDVFLGKDWNNFLADCRIVLGCEGGSSIHDPIGRIREEVDRYVKLKPEATYAEVRDAIYPGQDYNIELFAISPRHFEACITKTCQVLVEGKYHGIFKPNVHYIPLSRDFSNLEEVLLKIKDVEYCEAIAERAYKDIALDPAYTYAAFVSHVLSEITPNKTGLSLRWHLVKLSNSFNRCLGVPKFILNDHIRRFVTLVLKKTGTFEKVKAFYHKIRIQD